MHLENKRDLITGLAHGNGALLKSAKNAINDFCLKEYDGEADFSDLSNIEIAYTDWSDKETDAVHSVQAVVDLQNYALFTYVDGNAADEQNYDSLEAFMEMELGFLDFDSLVSLSGDADGKL